MAFASTEPEFPVRVFFLATDGEEGVSDEHGTTATDMDEVERAHRLDLQHGLWDRPSLEAAVGLAGAHVPVAVRSADFSHQAIATALVYRVES